MKYFLHDSTAFLDEKVTLIYLEYGYEAVGLFYVILEKLALQEQPVNETVLKSQLNIKKRLQNQLDFMYKIGLLELKNGDVFSINLLNFSQKYQIKKEKTRKRVSEWRDKQEHTNNVTSYKHVRNARKVKESKVNKDNSVFNFKNSFLDLEVDKKILEDWLQVRKTKKATNTETSYTKIINQIKLSGKTANECIKIAVEKDWKGFEAAWLKNIKTNDSGKDGYVYESPKNIL